MNRSIRPALSRRLFTRLGLAVAAPFLATKWGRRLVGGPAVATASAQTDGATATGTVVLPPTPACGDDDDLAATLPQTAGPFYTPDSPERRSLLEPGLAGRRLRVAGYVTATDCRPIAGALLDFWQADDAGVYDNVGYRLRGHQFAEADGRFDLETIVPGLYPGRTRHLHVHVQAPDQPVLTTQLYFPDEPANATDGIFDPALVMEVDETTEETVGTFHFVLELP